MILKYMIKNNTQNDFPLDPGEAWQFIVNCDDEYDACAQMEKVKVSAVRFGHQIMNVFLNDTPFDASKFATEGADSDDFPYDSSVVIDEIKDETKVRPR